MHTSIADTGARPGDKVKCVGETPTAGFGYFVPGHVYPVIDFCGVPSAYGQALNAKNTVMIPRRGYGWTWEKV